jgi:hypothetical protein
LRFNDSFPIVAVEGDTTLAAGTAGTVSFSVGLSAYGTNMYFLSRAYFV